MMLNLFRRHAPVESPVNTVDRNYHLSVVAALKGDAERLNADNLSLDRLAAKLQHQRDAARKTLRDIIADETPGANATVKRMAAKARAALPAEQAEAGYKAA